MTGNISILIGAIPAALAVIFMTGAVMLRLRIHASDLGIDNPFVALGSIILGCATVIFIKKMVSES